MHGRLGVLLVVLAAGCGWTPADEQVLTKFFEQSRVYDTTRLARYGTVAFDPRTDGVVERFEIVERGPEQPVGPGRVAKQLTVQAAVRSAAGRTSPRMLTITLERRSDAWLVTMVR